MYKQLNIIYLSNSSFLKNMALYYHSFFTSRFVYGTLKRNEPNHHYMVDSTFVTEATSVDKLPLVIASKYNIPFALNKPGVGHVSFSISSLF